MLITGTNGFIGRNFMEYFQERYNGVYCPKCQELNLLDSQAWNPENVYVDDPHPTDPNAHMIYGHKNFELFRTRG